VGIAAKATIDFRDRYLRSDTGGLRRLAADKNAPGTSHLEKDATQTSIMIMRLRPPALQRPSD
jgi:hypothetical protein